MPTALDELTGDRERGGTRRGSSTVVRLVGEHLPAAALLTAAGAVVLLALIRPDLPVTREPMSEYVHGPYSWVQQSVFFLVGFASLQIGWRSSRRPAVRRPAEGPFLITWSVGIVMAGLVDVEDHFAGTRHGAAHNLAVKLAFAALLAAALLDRLRSGGDACVRRTLLVGLLAAAIAVTAILEGSAGYGLAQRALGVIALTWLIAYARRSRPPAEAEEVRRRLR